MLHVTLCCAVVMSYLLSVF